MAASLTVPQLPSDLNPLDNLRPLMPTRGIVSLCGYGIRVLVERGHLVIEDGIGPARRRARFARVNHGLRRLVVIGSDGFVSLAALRWLADQKASFVMLERDGKILLATGPTGPRDARLRRAQAVALHSEVGLTIARDLIDRKLAEQQRVVRDAFGDATAACAIEEIRCGVPSAEDIETLRLLESRAAYAYWSCWRNLPILFPKDDLPRVPVHWQTFGARISPLTGSPRLSANPPNAMINYLFAILEAEARLAATALGLDPSLGVMHADAGARDSLACDLMEPVRPHLEFWVLKWLQRQPLRREWFFEERNGNCRLMPPLAERLAQTAPTWAQAVAPITERVAKALWQTSRKTGTRYGPATRLTQQHRRDAKGAPPFSVSKPQQPPRVCRDCGSAIPRGEKRCAKCEHRNAPDRMRAVAVKGRIFAQTPSAQGRRAAARRHHIAAQRSWDPSSQPKWLTETFYRKQIQQRLKHIGASKIASAIGVSVSYVFAIRAGKYQPHPRHWQTLALLVGL
jgi:CRISPR-associated endonuclease Cas1